jgi:hypothetical protein
MSPILPGLAVTCCRVRQRPVSRANPRPPRQRSGFPLYPAWSVADHLRFGWRRTSAGCPARAHRGRSQAARVAAPLRAGRQARPARREFLQDLATAAAAQQLSVALSSHPVADLEQICDYLIVLAAGRVQLAGPARDLLASHQLLLTTPCCTRCPASRLPGHRPKPRGPGHQAICAESPAPGGLSSSLRNRPASRGYC